MVSSCDIMTGVSPVRPDVDADGGFELSRERTGAIPMLLQSMLPKLQHSCSTGDV